MTGTGPAKVGDVLDMGAPEPPNVIGVESLAWADYGWGDGPTLADESADDDPEAELLNFGKTSAPSIDGYWKFYLGGKTYIDWETMLRRFGPVRVTHTSKENSDD
ncbi:hypothetical protein [Gordonia sp. QH-12]|uniref:hypothetical protein n=1 Tax=Gordonia sp. QH-12 TaxID=1437876 RepID=UPI000AA3476F|nr:hypothetical protein [Gordonia sp. QH-12]